MKPFFSSSQVSDGGEYGGQGRRDAGNGTFVIGRGPFPGEPLARDDGSLRALAAIVVEPARGIGKVPGQFVHVAFDPVG
jgi:hypothetical protein